MALIEIEWDGLFNKLLDWIKSTVREYGDEIIALIFVLVFLIAGVYRLGFGGGY